jgi:hypothetical protein
MTITQHNTSINIAYFIYFKDQKLIWNLSKASNISSCIRNNKTISSYISGLLQHVTTSYHLHLVKRKPVRAGKCSPLMYPETQSLFLWSPSKTRSRYQLAPAYTNVNSLVVVAVHQHFFL